MKEFFEELVKQLKGILEELPDEEDVCLARVGNCIKLIEAEQAYQDPGSAPVEILNEDSYQKFKDAAAAADKKLEEFEKKHEAYPCTCTRWIGWRYPTDMKIKLSWAGGVEINNKGYSKASPLHRIIAAQLLPELEAAMAWTLSLGIEDDQ